MEQQATDAEAVPSDAVQQPNDDGKGKKPAPGGRPRSIKTPLQREALEAAFLSKSSHACSREISSAPAQYKQLRC